MPHPGRTGGGEARRRLRLRRHAAPGVGDAGVAHALRRVDLPGWDSSLRGHAAAALQPASPIRRSRRCRTASGSRRRCSSCSRGGRGCCSSTSRPPGLDPVARHEILAELMDVVRDERRAILFSSHNTQDVEQISDQITFIDRGRIIDSSDKETFLDRLAASAPRRACRARPSRRWRASPTRAPAAASRSSRPRRTRLESRRPTRAPGSPSATYSR